MSVVEAEATMQWSCTIHPLPHAGQALSPWCVYISDQVALRGGKESQEETFLRDAVPTDNANTTPGNLVQYINPEPRSLHFVFLSLRP